MRLADFSPADQQLVVPEHKGRLAYRCLGCRNFHSIERLLYTCPDCGQVLLIEDQEFAQLQARPATDWRRAFDLRRMLNLPAVKGIFRYHELIAPVIPQDSVLYLGEGHSPLVEANRPLRDEVGLAFCYKNEGQNPSASFKDRGMAAAISYLNYLLKHKNSGRILSVCASTGDTSAAAALYASYLVPDLASAVVLPQGKVTPQQLSQPLGSGAMVFEIPGVFDDCMKVVEYLADHYQVALLNSKNAWRIVGQESYAFEVAQDLDYDLSSQVIVAPIGNAGNISAIMAGFLKLFRLRIISGLPKIIGVQSEHADPVFRYYRQPPEARQWQAVRVRPSAAQAAMIGDPVSMPRVIELAQTYEQAAQAPIFQVVQVSEQEIMDNMILANRHGHIACTQGGESLAGLRRALAAGFVNKDEHAILNATAHHLKFIDFQRMYFENAFPAEFSIQAKPELVNHPLSVRVPGPQPLAGNPLNGGDLQNFIKQTAQELAARLRLDEK